MAEYVKEKRRRGVKSAVLILDEVTPLEDWWKIIKYYIDKGELSTDVIIVSGSSSLGITKSVERFPGRKGYGKEISVLPLSFPQFVEVHGYKREEVLSDSAYPRHSSRNTPRRGVSLSR
ncbi:AAA family ATPase [Sulfuracidifex tepidarius]|uniref:AAA family ATPase n=1 Tax=Sulfuracidifex tepidarius TaxID=1294262 RepID=UPI000B0BF345|nr:AAA family ATPase [Sulfuracidifex tepidarius]